MATATDDKKRVVIGNAQITCNLQSAAQLTLDPQDNSQFTADFTEKNAQTIATVEETRIICENGDQAICPTTSQPCNPSIDKWQCGADDMQFKGIPVLLESSCATCANGGMLTINDPQQDYISAQPDPSTDQVKRDIQKQAWKKAAGGMAKNIAYDAAAGMVDQAVWNAATGGIGASSFGNTDSQSSSSESSTIHSVVSQQASVDPADIPVPGKQSLDDSVTSSSSTESSVGSTNARIQGQNASGVGSSLGSSDTQSANASNIGNTPSGQHTLTSSLDNQSAANSTANSTNSAAASSVSGSESTVAQAASAASRHAATDAVKTTASGQDQAGAPQKTVADMSIKADIQGPSHPVSLENIVTGVEAEKTNSSLPFGKAAAIAGGAAAGAFALSKLKFNVKGEPEYELFIMKNASKDDIAKNETDKLHLVYLGNADDAETIELYAVVPGIEPAPFDDVNDKERGAAMALLFEATTLVNKKMLNVKDLKNNLKSQVTYLREITEQANHVRVPKSIQAAMQNVNVDTSKTSIGTSTDNKKALSAASSDPQASEVARVFAKVFPQGVETTNDYIDTLLAELPVTWIEKFVKLLSLHDSEIYQQLKAYLPEWNERRLHHIADLLSSTRDNSKVLKV